MDGGDHCDPPFARTGSEATRRETLGRALVVPSDDGREYEREYGLVPCTRRSLQFAAASPRGRLQALSAEHSSPQRFRADS